MNQPTIHKLARRLSQVFNPFLLLPIIFLVAILLTHFPATSTQIRWFGVVLISNFILPLGFIFYLRQKGIVLDDTLDNKNLHRHRLIALFPITLILLAEIIIMKFYTIYEPLYIVLLSSFIVTVIGGIVSYFWKISAHSIGLSTSITLLYLLLGPWALIGLIILPPLTWSRLVLRRHTPLQLTGGIILPPIIILTIFNWLKPLW